MTQLSASIYSDAIEEELSIWHKENKVRRFWACDPTLWTNSDESQWMGWLNVTLEKSEVMLIEALANEIKAAGFSDIVLMGMGGSSLCPAMMAKTFGEIATYPRLHILDSTDPQQIHHLEEQIDLKKLFSLFQVNQAAL